MFIALWLPQKAIMPASVVVKIIPISGIFYVCARVGVVVSLCLGLNTNTTSLWIFHVQSMIVLHAISKTPIRYIQTYASCYNEVYEKPIFGCKYRENISVHVCWNFSTDCDRSQEFLFWWNSFLYLSSSSMSNGMYMYCCVSRSFTTGTVKAKSQWLWVCNCL